MQSLVGFSVIAKMHRAVLPAIARHLVLIYGHFVYFWLFVFVVSASASDCLERLVSEMTCYVSSGM